jgi:glycine/D-amino acid oxidase-like deaminating enzyme
VAPAVGPGAVSGYQRLSLWWEAIPVPLPPRPSLTEDLDVDVCIVGAGFTGLWTAHSLALADPSLRVAVLEREVAGFGASGRNGGWCSALFATSDAALARQHGIDAMRAMRRAMQETVDIVGASAMSEGIDCHFAKGGSIDLVRSEAQWVRALAEVDEARALGFGEHDVRWLGPDETGQLIGAAGAIGATFTPHCAVVQPALLARGLADAVERHGVRVYEHTEVVDIRAGEAGDRPSVITSGGTVRADFVVRATEAWTPTLPGLERAIVPVYSLMVATEPLGADFWSRAGLESRASFADHRHMIIYGQRTADGRIAFGGRGAPPSTASRPCTPCCARRSPSSSQSSVMPASHTPGAGRSASRGTGTRRSGSTAPRAWPGREGTSVTGWPPPTWPVGHWPTSSPGQSRH